MCYVLQALKNMINYSVWKNLPRNFILQNYGSSSKLMYFFTLRLIRVYFPLVFFLSFFFLEGEEKTFHCIETLVRLLLSFKVMTPSRKDKMLSDYPCSREKGEHHDWISPGRPDSSEPSLLLRQSTRTTTFI